MNAIEEVTAQGPADATFVLFILLHPFLLLVPLGFEEEAAGLVRGATQTPEQSLGPAVGVGDRERLLDPRADVFDGPEASGLDLVSELLLLRFGPFSPVSFVKKCTEGVQA